MTVHEPKFARGMFVNGEYVNAASGKTLPVENPKNGEVFAVVAEGDAADIEAAVTVAERAFEKWGRTTGAERADIMERAAQIMRRRLGEFVTLEVDQIGRARREMAAQLARAPEWLSYFGAVARTHEDTVIPFGTTHLNYTRRVPLGAVGHLTPWNHPVLILMKKVAPSLAAGNTMVVKPSEIAPITPMMLGECLKEAGLPDGVYNVVPGYGPTAGLALTAHPRIRKIDLTGGTETGRVVVATAAKNLVRASAELGGKASVIVFPDTEIDRAVAATMFAGFVAAGQTCVQGARLVVHRSIHDQVIEKLVKRTGAIRLGDPQDPDTQLGPLASKKQRDITERYVQIGKDEGATVAVGGRRPDGKAFERGYYYLPTVFTGVKNEMRIAQEEIFGPVICVIPFDTEEEAIALGNGTQFGLGASVWTKDVARAHRVTHALQCGIVWINDHHRIDPASPWGGFKMSGIGRENGLIAYEEYTQLQSVIVSLTDGVFDWYSDEGGTKRYS